MKKSVAIVIKIVVLLLLVKGVIAWRNKPYCTIELLEKSTVRGQKNALVYGISKVIAQRKELYGTDPYKLYICIHDPDGIDTYELLKDGENLSERIKFEDAYSFEGEIDGDTELGMHHYQLTVKDRKGNTSKSESYIKVKPVAAIF